jgi:hypothetical protein
MQGSAQGSGLGALAAGLASVATLPLAVYLTRFSGSYELLHAGLAIPLAAVLGVLAIRLARGASRQQVLSLSGERSRAAAVGRVLGAVGILMAAAALVSLGVYALLEYVGSRD